MSINHDERRKRMHSTDISAIMGLSSKKTAWEVWKEKRDEIVHAGGSDATDAGQLLEPAVLDKAEQAFGPLERNVQVIADYLDFPLAATLDGRVIKTGVPVEAKTSGIVGPIYGNWGEEDTDIVPDVYLVQATVQMICSGAELVHLMALLGGRGFVRYRINRDEELARAIVQSCSLWWERHIELGIEPLKTSPVPMEVVKRLKRVPKKTIEFDAAGVAAVAEYERLREAASIANDAKEAAQSELILLMGDAEAARLPDGRSATYFEATRDAYEVEKSTYRTLRIKKAPGTKGSKKDKPQTLILPASEVDYKVANRVKLPTWLKVKRLNDDPHCRWCGATLTMGTATFEHLVALDVGGTNDEHNISIACAKCNNKRGNASTLPTTVKPVAKVVPSNRCPKCAAPMLGRTICPVCEHIESPLITQQGEV